MYHCSQSIFKHSKHHNRSIQNVKGDSQRIRNSKDPDSIWTEVLYLNMRQFWFASVQITITQIANTESKCPKKVSSEIFRNWQHLGGGPLCICGRFGLHRLLCRGGKEMARRDIPWGMDGRIDIYILKICLFSNIQLLIVVRCPYSGSDSWQYLCRDRRVWFGTSGVRGRRTGRVKGRQEVSSRNCRETNF